MEVSSLDEKSINVLLQKYEYIIKIILSKYQILPKDYDDFLQEGRLGLLKAIYHYADNRGAKFPSFAAVCIDRQILSYFRSLGRQKNRPLSKCLSLDILDYIAQKNPTYSQNGLEDDIVSRVFYRDIFHKTMMLVNEREREIYNHYIKGYSVSELSETYNMPKKQVYVIIAKVKKRIVEKLNNSDY